MYVTVYLYFIYIYIHIIQILLDLEMHKAINKMLFPPKIISSTCSSPVFTSPQKVCGYGMISRSSAFFFPQNFLQSLKWCEANKIV